MLNLVPEMAELVPYVGAAGGLLLFGSGVSQMDALYLVGGTVLGGMLVRQLKLGIGPAEDIAKGPLTLVSRMAIPLFILWWLGDLSVQNVLAYKLGEVTAEVLFQGQSLMGAIMS